MSARGSELLAGSVIGGYRVDELISRGGMGVVYRATHVALGRIYALKVLAPELANDEHFRARFQREIRTAASLHHPNVVQIHYAGEQDGQLFLAMDLIDGANLGTLIARGGKFDPERAVGLLDQIAAALDAAHSRGLVHRDVKPANILIRVENGEERAYLTDFGLAKRFDAPTALTMRGAVVGTVDYMPPEQITGGQTDARSDIYAAGCVFFEMLTGKVPYQREHSVATLFAHVYDPPPVLEDSAAASHPTFGPVIAKAMAKVPADRYLSAGDFARDARAALSGARYTGPPSVVGTGDARPVDVGDEPRTQVGLAAIERTLPEPASATNPMQTANATGGPAAPIEERAVDAGPSAPDGPSLPRNATHSTPATAPQPAQPDPAVGGSRRRPRRRLPVAVLAILLAGAAAAVLIATLSSGKKPTSAATSPKPRGTPFGTTLAAVPTNHVRATGKASIVLNGDLATVTVTTRGLLNGAPHAMHIHAFGLGICPPASAARLHNGHRTISTLDGVRYYGDPVVSLTTRGDTSIRSIVAFNRYPTSGNIDYRRTIRISKSVIAQIRARKAVVVVHGIDYDGSGIYDNVLGPSDLDPSLTADSTAPALCGPLTPTAGTIAAVKSGDSNTALIYTASLAVSDMSMNMSMTMPMDMPMGMPTPR